MNWMLKASDAVFDSLCALFGVDPESDASFFRFRDANSDETTFPQANRTDNVCYYTLSNEASQSNAWTQQKVVGDELHVTSNIPLTCLFTFYGPNADIDAERLWSLIGVDSGYGCPRSILRQAGIVLVPSDTERVVVSPELEGSLWRRRCDVRVRMSMRQEEVIRVGTVTHVPDIIVRN